jgi:hypothetical protein
MKTIVQFFRRWFAKRAAYKVDVVARGAGYKDRICEYIMDRDANGRLNMRSW